MKKYLFTLLLLLSLPSLKAQSGLAARMGAGNFTNGRVSAREWDQMRLLNELGEGMARFNIYPNKYWQNGQVIVNVMDSLMGLAYENGVVPMILFEQYGTPVGDYDKWYAIGSAFASHYGPGGTWGDARGITGWGVTLFAAFNEPDAMRRDSNAINYDEYKTALQGLADGVHSINDSLRVIPGGFMSANAFSDYTLGGYGTAIAPLLNDGTLDGIDLHTYFGKYAPVTKYKFSAQSNFNSIKKACGITREISFYASEFNYKAHQEPVPEDTAAKHLLTMIWDNLGVCGSDSHTVVGRMSLIWGHFDTAYSTGIAYNVYPWVPKSRGRVWQNALDWVQGMQFISADPLSTGVYVLESESYKLWVFQNRPQWSSLHGTQFLITGIPPHRGEVQHYTWQGLIDSMPAPGDSLIYTGLKTRETHIFRVRKDFNSGINEEPDPLRGIYFNGEGLAGIPPALFASDYRLYDLNGRQLAGGTFHSDFEKLEAELAPFRLLLLRISGYGKIIYFY